MRILQLALTEEDGVPMRMARALAAAETARELRPGSGAPFGSSVRCDVAIVRTEAPPPGPPDWLHANLAWGHWQRLVTAADVVHVYGAATLELFRPELENKAVVVHLRRSAEELPRGGLDAPHVVTTPRLLRDLPHAVLLPDAVTTPERGEFGRNGDTPIRIVWLTARSDRDTSAFFEEVFGRMQSALPGRVEYVGDATGLGNAERRALMARCHLGIADNDWTLVHSEALAHGLVVVGRLERAHREPVERALGGRLPIANTSSLSEAGHKLLALVQDALTRPDRFDRLRAEAQAFAADRLSPSALLPQWLEIYASLVGARGAHGTLDDRPGAAP